MNAEMLRALRLVSVERGHDPGDFALVAFGGAEDRSTPASSPKSWGSERFSSPRRPASSRRSGWLRARSARPCRSYVIPFEDAGLLLREGALDLRYRGQSFELTVSLDGDPAESFHRAHEERYGYADRGRPIELVATGTPRLLPGPELELRAASRCPCTARPWWSSTAPRAGCPPGGRGLGRE